MPDFTDIYLAEVKTEVLVRSLYRSGNAPQILRSFAFHCDNKAWRPWILLHPALEASQILLLEDTAVHLDAQLGRRLAKLHFPEFSFSAGFKAGWVKDVVNVMDALGVPFTVGIATAWKKGDLVALAGISDKTGLVERQMEIRALAFDLGQAVLRVHEIELVQGELEGTRLLLEGASKVLILTNTEGVIFAYTQHAREILLTLLHGTRRPNGPRAMPALPSQIVSVLPTVKEREQVVLSDRASAVINVIQRDHGSTALPLFIVELFVEQVSQENLLSPQKLDRLTGRERELLQLLLQGKRDKEIATISRIALGTVRNHISKIYGKLGCNGRPQLLSMAASLQIVHEVPALGRVDGIEFHPAMFDHRVSKP